MANTMQNRKKVSGQDFRREKKMSKREIFMSGQQYRREYKSEIADRENESWKEAVGHEDVRGCHLVWEEQVMALSVHNQGSDVTTVNITECLSCGRRYVGTFGWVM